MKIENKRYYIYFILVVILIVFSWLFSKLWSTFSQPDIDKLKEDISIHRLDKDLFINENLSDLINLFALEREYGEFWEIYNQHIIKTLGETNEETLKNIQTFTHDSLIQEIKIATDSKFPSLNNIQKELIEAFARYKYYISNSQTPKIYSCITGFNQSIIVGKESIGISLDKYLGTESHFYSELGIPKYKKDLMYPKKISRDVILSWLETEYPDKGKNDYLLNHMIHQGKLLYTLDLLFPNMPDSVKIGYSKKQIEWCKKNEANLWSYMINNNLLFSSKLMDRKHFLGNAPFTAPLSKKSPPRLGEWLGWQILRNYSKKNKCSITYLFSSKNNSQEILRDSKYFPQ